MLHYNGTRLAMELGRAARQYLMLYAKKGEKTAFVPYMDLEKLRKWYVKFEWLAEQWVYVDLVDANK